MNFRDRTQDNDRRDVAGVGRAKIYQVLDVLPHIEPFPGDKNFNIVELLLKHRMIADGCVKDEPPIRKRVICMQRDHGKHYGTPWTPRIGDLVVVITTYDEHPIVLGILSNEQQEPLCRPNSSGKCYDTVHKRARFKKPGQITDKDGKPLYPDYVDFPEPEHPDCHKWWHDFGDEVWCFECPLGHANPKCDVCDHIDKIVGCTFLKHFGRDTQTETDKKYRVKFHHKSGSIFYFDEDGTVHLENKVAEARRAHITMHPDASIVMRSGDADNENNGAYIYLAGHYGNEPGRVIIENAEHKFSRIEISANGKIDIKRDRTTITISESGAIILQSPTEINLNAPVIYQNGEQIHPAMSEVGDDWV
jgi:hypothetical protein